MSISSVCITAAHYATCGAVPLPQQENARQPDAGTPPPSDAPVRQEPRRHSSMASNLRAAFLEQQRAANSETLELTTFTRGAATTDAGSPKKAGSAKSETSKKTALSEAGIAPPSPEDMQALVDAGKQIQADFAAGKYADYGKEVTIAGIAAVEIPNDDKGIRNFRSLLSASKEAIGTNGVSVLVRKHEGYTGARLFAHKQDHGGTVGGLTPEGTIISICKGSMKVPREEDNRFTDIIDILCAAHEEKSGGGVPHFACMASIAELYNKKTGAEMIGVVNKYVEDHTPGWTDQHTQDNKKLYDKFVYHGTINGEPAEIHLPLVGMRMNRELREQIKETGKPLPKPTQNFTDFSTLPSYDNAHDIYAAAYELDQQELAAGKGKQKAADESGPSRLAA